MNCNEKEKIEFIQSNAYYFDSNILDKVDEKDNVMLLILSILMSNKNLHECEEYQKLSNYLKNKKIISFPNNQNMVGHIISTIRGFVSRIYQHDKKGEIIELRLQYYQQFINELEQQKTYIKQA